jgi:putative ABC transport system permease protein
MLTHSSMFGDMRYAVRQLLRNPGFAATAILTLALGVGLSTAIVSILNAWLLQPLPLKNPQQVVLLWRAATGSPEQPAYYFSWRDYLYFLPRSHAFQSLGASFERGYVLTGSGEPQALHGGIASKNLFSTLGTQAYRGRLFLPEDENGPAVAVISHSLWTTRFRQSLAALGQTLLLNDKPYKIIGVLPSNFSYRVLDQPRDADVWTLIQPGDPEFKQNSAAAVAIVGRLRQETGLNAARSEIGGLQLENDRQYSDVPQSTALLVGLQQDNTRTVKPSLLVLGGAIGLLLLIACTNTASLIVGRNVQREKEFAIRAALGSSVRRLLVQLLSENLVLYGVSGTLAVLIAYGAVRGFVAWNPFAVLPAQPITVSLRVLLAAALLTLITGLIFGVSPVFSAARLRIHETLRSSSFTASAASGTLRSRSITVVTQIALSVVLLIGASLMLTTFLRLNSQPLGFNPTNTAVIELSLSHKRYSSDADLSRFADRLIERFQSLPGVNAAGMTFSLNLADTGTEMFQIESQPEIARENLPQAAPVTVSPGYMQAMGISVIHGRDFSNTDTQTNQPVVLINEEAARRNFPGKNPLGEYVRIGDPRENTTQPSHWLEVVGIVSSTRSVRYNQIAWDMRPEIYTDYRQQQIHPYAQNWDYTSMFFVVRSRPEVSLNTAAIQKAVWSEDPDLPVGTIKSLGEMVASLQSQPRVRARLLTAFAVLTLLLAAIGIYGVMAESVAQRYREIGIRMALGSNRAEVLALILRQALGLAIAGELLGVVLGIVAVQFMKSLLYGITFSSPAVVVAVIGIVTLVALLASSYPAGRAASVDPVRSLRME